MPHLQMSRATLIFCQLDCLMILPPTLCRLCLCSELLRHFSSVSESPSSLLLCGTTQQVSAECRFVMSFANLRPPSWLQDLLASNWCLCCYRRPRLNQLSRPVSSDNYSFQMRSNYPLSVPRPACYYEPNAFSIPRSSPANSVLTAASSMDYWWHLISSWCSRVRLQLHHLCYLLLCCRRHHRRRDGWPGLSSCYCPISGIDVDVGCLQRPGSVASVHFSESLRCES